ncbi:MAG: UDP-N-acetylmuramoyl-L-alanyl-D-glutamate--2,6-diaminopimelate ligase [Magnetovibrio sp.]|nr:UDP-N-acetylmuramoyl-L-alanyl-D-glutamate--2,6-diaminopimelate ligase [Magnetovibrio sp.]
MGAPQSSTELNVTELPVQVPAPVIAPLCAHPSQDLYVIGVTGTNGKTTVAYLIGEVLKAAGHKPFVLGTLNSGNRDLSTPEGPDIINFMRAHLKNGGTHFVMEVTSEGIDQDRVDGVEFDVKILTNITRDHLDYHKTFQNYESTKLRFMDAGLAHKIYPKSFHDTAIDFVPQLLGDFNYLNIQAAACALRYMGVEETYIHNTLSTCRPPRGRMEGVEKGQSYLVLVDYAHTPDGLESVLKTAKGLAKQRNGRLLVLFGCGGNRDRGKRPKMGKIASEVADLLVITDDNPRSESSQTIMDEIFSGVHLDFDACVLIENRRAAIEHIIKDARPNDVVILAGKGHEMHQITNSGTFHFDDREEAENAITLHLKIDSNIQRPILITN